MARDTNGGTDKISFSAFQNFTGVACSVSCIVQFDALTRQKIIWSSEEGTGIESLWMSLGATDALADTWRWVRYGDTFESKHAADTTLTTGVWYNLVATDGGAFTDHTDIHLYRDGVEESYDGTNTQNGSGSEEAHDGPWMLAARSGANTRGINGKLAEIGVWDRVLTASEVAILAKRYSPLFIPSGLVWYAPIMGKNSPERDIVGGDSGTLTGTTAFAHPRIIYPSPKQMEYIKTIVIPPGGSVVKDIINSGIIPFAR